MTIPHTPESWEEEFDRRYIRGDFGITISDFNSVPLKELKLFIRSLLLTHEKKVQSEVVREILDMAEIHMNDGSWVYAASIEGLALAKGLDIKE